MVDTFTWTKRYALIIAVAISVTTAFSLLFLIICLGMLPSFGNEVGMLVGLTLPTVLSLYLIPKTFQKLIDQHSNVNKKKSENKKFIWLVTGCFLTFCILYGIRYKTMFDTTAMIYIVIFHYVIVSVGEEFTYRKLIPQLLVQKYKTWIAIILSAAMFAFILHINENIVTNLCIRFPMGVIFGYIAMKTDKILYTIILHTIYNLTALVI